MTIIGSAYYPDDGCSGCEECTVRYVEEHPGQWVPVMVACSHNCEMPEMDGANEHAEVIKSKTGVGSEL